jgi:hypothetical protein
MPTQEERLASLESFRTETLYAYKDMAYEITILKGLGEDSIKRLAELRREMNEFRAEVNVKLDHLDTRFDLIVERLAVIQQSLDERK